VDGGPPGAPGATPVARFRFAQKGHRLNPLLARLGKLSPREERLALTGGACGASLARDVLTSDEDVARREASVRPDSHRLLSTNGTPRLRAYKTARPSLTIVWSTFPADRVSTSATLMPSVVSARSATSRILWRVAELVGHLQKEPLFLMLVISQREHGQYNIGQVQDASSVSLKPRRP